MLTTDKKVVSYCHPQPKAEFGFLRCNKSFFQKVMGSYPIQSKLFDLMKFNQLNELNRVKLRPGWVNLSMRHCYSFTCIKHQTLSFELQTKELILSVLIPNILVQLCWFSLVKFWGTNVIKGVCRITGTNCKSQCFNLDLREIIFSTILDKIGARDMTGKVTTSQLRLTNLK